MQLDTINREIIVNVIIDGDADTFLDSIAGAIKKRREAINSKKMFMLSPGDTVMFNSQTRPKYLQGLEATVVRCNQKRVVVKIKDADSRARKYAYGEFTTPVSLVEKIG